MEPTTLFFVYALSGGPETTYRGDFASVGLCQQAVSRMIETKRPDMNVIRTYCWKHGSTAPAWVSVDTINGVPLDPAYRP